MYCVAATAKGGQRVKEGRGKGPQQSKRECCPKKYKKGEIHA